MLLKLTSESLPFVRVQPPCSRRRLSCLGLGIHAGTGAKLIKIGRGDPREISFLYDDGGIDEDCKGRASISCSQGQRHL